MVIQPNSNTNPSTEHRVALFSDWSNFCAGKILRYPFESFKAAKDAYARAGELNEVREV